MAEQGWTKVPNVFARSTTVSAMAKIVWLVIASRANADGVAWPSRQTIAEDAGVSKASVERALPELRDAGWVTWDQKVAADGTPCGPNRYRVQGVPLTEAPVPHTEVPLHQGEAPGTSHGGTGVPLTEALRRPIEEDPVSRPIEQVITSTPNLFDEFWQAYPRKAGKTSAKTAWTKATKDATPATLIEAAERLRDDPNLPEKTFIPHPSKWLNGGHWEDDPLPSRATKPVDRQGDLLQSEMKRIRAKDQMPMDRFDSTMALTNPNAEPTTLEIGAA